MDQTNNNDNNIIKVLENSSKLINYARDAGCIIIHAPINFEPGHSEI